jgi:hypothetical protein
MKILVKVSSFLLVMVLYGLVLLNLACILSEKVCTFVFSIGLFPDPSIGETILMFMVAVFVHIFYKRTGFVNQ